MTSPVELLSRAALVSNRLRSRSAEPEKAPAAVAAQQPPSSGALALPPGGHLSESGVPRRTPGTDISPPATAASPTRHAFDFTPLLEGQKVDAGVAGAVLRGTVAPGDPVPHAVGADAPGPAPKESAPGGSFLDLVRKLNNRSANRANGQATQVAAPSSQPHLHRAQEDPLPSVAPDPPWDDPWRPAGSMFCAEQWAAARDDGKYCVFEMAAATERQLVRLPKPMQQLLVKRVVDGKLVQVEQSSADLDQARRDAMLKFLAPALDGCLVLGPGARPTHTQGMVKNAITLVDPLQIGRNYKLAVIEPQQRQPSEEPIWLCFSNGASVELDKGFFAEGEASTDPVESEARPSRDRG